MLYVTTVAFLLRIIKTRLRDLLRYFGIRFAFFQVSVLNSAAITPSSSTILSSERQTVFNLRSVYLISANN